MIDPPKQQGYSDEFICVKLVLKTAAINDVQTCAKRRAAALAGWVACLL